MLAVSLAYVVLGRMGGLPTPLRRPLCWIPPPWRLLLGNSSIDNEQHQGGSR